ncbi:DEAD/DEAH box helicase [Psychrobacter sp. HD31]|uniref:DEAD/DEAH box helicase n=1 Tax=Psychrobacter sp. HD31 TaxID=3112003 RepID=UPI003DA669C3
MTQQSQSFADLGLKQPLLDALNKVGYSEPSPIQAQAIPHLLNRHDILGQAQTGTGKTAAFALPTLQNIDLSLRGVQVLVLAPTRELAIQVADAYKDYAQFMPKVNVLPIYGGADYRTQINGLKRGAQIVVGTPGRVMDHMEKGTLKLDNLQALVLDEADEMLRMGFIDDVEWVLSHTPQETQIALFSATMPAQIKAITEKYLKNEVVIQIAKKAETASTIEQFYLCVESSQKMAGLRQLLEIEDRDATIIFVNTKAMTEELASKLNYRGHKAAALNGDLQQKQRERVIDQLKKGMIDIVIATDVAARGIDVERISHVINYDLPHDSESYVHRIGRTGRAGRSGKTILLMTPRDRRSFGFIEKDTKTTIPMYPMPSLTDINAQRVAHFKQRIVSEMEHKNLEYLEQMLEEMYQNDDLDLISIAAALASMSLNNSPLLLGKRDTVASIDLATLSSRSSRQRDGRGRGRDRNKDNRRNRKDRDENQGDRVSREDMENYRLGVGYRDNIKPGHIVGAIANEAGIEGYNIGPINISDNHTDVMLPKGMPAEVLKHLQKTRINGKLSQIEQMDADTSASEGNNRKRSGGKDRRGNQERRNKRDFKKSPHKGRDGDKPVRRPRKKFD